MSLFLARGLFLGWCWLNLTLFLRELFASDHKKQFLRCRLEVEGLEERCTPARYIWSLPQGGANPFWSVPGNWRDPMGAAYAQPPGPQDDVEFIANGLAGSIVDVGPGLSNRSLLIPFGITPSRLIGISGSVPLAPKAGCRPVRLMVWELSPLPRSASLHGWVASLLGVVIQETRSIWKRTQLSISTERR